MDMFIKKSLVFDEMLRVLLLLKIIIWVHMKIAKMT